MDTPEEIAREDWFAEIQSSISEEAVQGFTSGRLRSYYLGNPELAVEVLTLFKEGKSIKSSSPTAATILFAAVIEVTLKKTILKPVVYGLVHNESIADLVSDLVVKNNGLDRFKDILLAILGQYSQVNFGSYKLTEHSKTVWEEIAEVQRARNSVAHSGTQSTVAMAELSQQIAGIVIVEFLQSVLSGLGLELRKDGRIANIGVLSG